MMVTPEIYKGTFSAVAFSIFLSAIYQLSKDSVHHKPYEPAAVDYCADTLDRTEGDASLQNFVFQSVTTPSGEVCGEVFRRASALERELYGK